MFDDMKARFFDDEAQFKKAMGILGNYELDATGNWASVEPILTALNSYDSHLLEQAIKYETLQDKKRIQAGITQQPAPAPAPAPAQDHRIDDIHESMQVLKERVIPLNTKPLSELVNDYLAELQGGWKEKNINTNVKDIKPKLQLFVEVVGDMDSKDLQPSHAMRFKAALFKLPSNRTKGIFAKKSVADLLAMDVPQAQRLSGSTIKNYAGKVSSFLNWMGKNNFCNRDLNEPLRGIKTPEKPDHEERPIFTPGQLTSLFESKEYVAAGHKKPSHYWVPLLALFTGARQNELCQLYREDIYKHEDTGIWVIDINEKNDKKLKKAHSARLIPIHKKLKDLGFLDYVESINHERIFPDLESKRDGYGQKFSRWFCDTYLNEKHCNIRSTGESSDPVFHSFRHNVATQLDERGIQSHHISHILGHTPDGGSETTGRYIKPAELVQRNRMVNKLSYPLIDFDKIRHWKRGIRSIPSPSPSRKR